jgi:hypothetical protein
MALVFVLLMFCVQFYFAYRLKNPDSPAIPVEITDRAKNVVDQGTSVINTGIGKVNETMIALEEAREQKRCDGCTVKCGNIGNCPRCPEAV